MEADAESISSESTDKTDVESKDGRKSVSPTPSLDYSFKPISSADLFRGATKSGLCENVEDRGGKSA